MPPCRLSPGDTGDPRHPLPKPAMSRLTFRPTAGLCVCLLAFSALPRQIAGEPADQSRNAAPSSTTLQQRQSAADLGRDVIWTDEFGIRFALIPPGEFVMGRADDPLAPPHTVRLTQPFYLSLTEITQGQYRAVMADEPSYFDLPGEAGDRLPVEQVGFSDAVAFCAALTDGAGGTYRLPTEAEWEYACRAGQTDAVALAACAWFVGNSGRRTHPVATQAPNALGLYDLQGNVWEWVADYWHAYPRGGRRLDPLVRHPNAPLEIDHERILRGGAWNVAAERCDPGFRLHTYEQTTAAPFVGFRVVCEVDPEVRDPGVSDQ